MRESNRLDLSFLERALSLARKAADAHAIADSLRVLGMIARDADNPGEARSFLSEALGLQRGLSDWTCASFSLSVLGDLALRNGEPAAASALFAEALVLQRSIAHWHWIADSLWGLAATAAAQGQWVRAARLLGCEEALRSDSNARFRLARPERREAVLEAVRQAMPKAAFAGACREGRTMAREDVWAYALADRDPVYG